MTARSAYDPAVEATRAFRAEGGLVVLLSNSPRPSPGVKRQLTDLGVPPDAYDATVTSGDLTRYELNKQPGARVFHLGPERDRPIFAGLDVVLVDADAAELVVCTGLFDDESRDARALCRAIGAAGGAAAADALRQSGPPGRAGAPPHLLRGRTRGRL